MSKENALENGVVDGETGTGVILHESGTSQQRGG